MGHAALPWNSAGETEASKVVADGRIASDSTVASVEGGHGVALVDWLRTIIGEQAELLVSLVHVTDLLRLAAILQKRVEECLVATWSISFEGAHASFCFVHTGVILQVASSPLVGDWVTLRKALVHIEAIRDIIFLHGLAVQLVLASSLEPDNLIIESHGLAVIIIHFFPVSPA
jgi:hypothetical protein